MSEKRKVSQMLKFRFMRVGSGRVRLTTLENYLRMGSHTKKNSCQRNLNRKCTM